jgi:toxin HigB-1
MKLGAYYIWVLGMRFHGLKGQDRGRFAVDASGNWRITFGWDGMDAIDVDLEDNH